NEGPAGKPTRRGLRLSAARSGLGRVVGRCWVRCRTTARRYERRPAGAAPRPGHAPRRRPPAAGPTSATRPAHRSASDRSTEPDVVRRRTMSLPTEPTSAPAGTTAPRIRPFEVHVPEEQLGELRRRVGAARLPSRELVADRAQGVQPATVRELARYWADGYDWRACEERPNALPQHTTEIDGVEIHFVHVRSPHPDALPLIMTHGRPGSV